MSKLIFARHLYFMGDIYQIMAEINKSPPTFTLHVGCKCYIKQSINHCTALFKMAVNIIIVNYRQTNQFPRR